MLTADLVRATRRDGVLKLSPLDAKKRAAALEVAGALVEIAAAQVGEVRAAFDEAVRAVTGPAADRKIALGLAKLVEDRCTFDAAFAQDPAALREALFTRAAAARRDPAGLDRAAVVAETAAALGIAPEALEASLFADLPASHVLRGFERIAPDALLRAYERAQVQAVLLRALRVRLEVEARAAGALRSLIRTLKFQRLLFTVTPLSAGRCALEIDGPLSLFGPTARYGLALALIVPALDGCDRWTLEADVLWGKARAPARFRAEGGAALAGEEPRLPDEVDALRARLNEAGASWRAEPSGALLHLPGVGTCVPDLELRHPEAAETYYLEVLGYWSRPAVWRRVEMVENGFPYRIVFAASERLRVDEGVIGEGLPAALYVYKGAPRAAAVLERLERLRLGRLSCSC